MPVSAVGGVTPWVPLTPPGSRAGSGFAAPGPTASLTAAAQAATGAQAQSAAALAIAQSQELTHGGGGGGGGGGHAHKAGMKAIEDVAARAGVKVEVRERSPAERQAEIDRLKLLANLRTGQVNAKGDGEGGGRHQQPQDGRQPGRGREQPAGG